MSSFIARVPLSTRCFMVEPVTFFMNPETAKDNVFQHDDGLKTMAAGDVKKYVAGLSAAAYREHQSVREALSSADVPYYCIKGLENKPDCIFPNNCYSIHHRPTSEEYCRFVAILYPMSPGRRDEITPEFFNFLVDLCGERNVHDLRDWEKKQQYLEGTGALNFSVDESRVYMGSSIRGSEQVLREAVAPILDISQDNVHVFEMHDENEHPVYHTNVCGWVGAGISGWCFDAVQSVEDRRRLEKECTAAGKVALNLSHAEIRNFCGNALEVMTSDGTPKLSMSECAYSGLTKENKTALEKHYGPKNLLFSGIPTIEKYGGGSVRCLQAKLQLFAPAAGAKDGGSAAVAKLDAVLSDYVSKHLSGLMC